MSNSLQSLNLDLSLDNPSSDPAFPGNLLHSIHISKRLKYNSDLDTPQVLEDATKLIAFSMPVTQYPELNTNIEDGSKVVLGMTLLIQNLSVPYLKVSGPTAARYINEGVKIVMRVRLRDNTFINVNDSSWEHVISKEQMGTGQIGEGDAQQLTIGNLFVDNLPGDAAGVNFTPGVNNPGVNYEWDVDFVFSTVADLLESLANAGNAGNFWRGARILFESPPSIYEVDWPTSSPFNLFTSAF